jgi:hypothetical protein
MSFVPEGSLLVASAAVTLSALAYRLTAIGRDRRGYARMTARNLRMGESDFRQPRTLAVAQGYDVGALRRMPGSTV